MAGRNAALIFAKVENVGPERSGVRSYSKDRRYFHPPIAGAWAEGAPVLARLPGPPTSHPGTDQAGARPGPHPGFPHALSGGPAHAAGWPFPGVTLLGLPQRG